MAEIVLYFDWNTFRPDQRQYRQQSIELHPGTFAPEYASYQVAVAVPLESRIIYNSEAIIQAKLGNGEEPLPVLTLTGMKYVIDKFDALFEEKKADTKTTSDDEWEEDLPEKSGKTENKETSGSDEEWEEDNKNKPDETNWEESEDDWN